MTQVAIFLSGKMENGPIFQNHGETFSFQSCIFFILLYVHFLYVPHPFVP